MTEQTDFQAITKRQQQTWATGDFNAIAMTIMGVAEGLVASIDPRPHERVLDVACGSGNAALVAARRFCDVTGVDYVPALLDRARQRAAADGVTAEFIEGDAQALPFPDHAFDVVLSTFGVMFAPDQPLAAKELLRVCKPGGRIGMSNWMPTEFGGDFFRAVAKHMPPPPGVKPASRWGTDDGLHELLGAGSRKIHTERRAVPVYFRSMNQGIEIFKQFFGPTARAFQTLDAAGQASLEADLRDVFTRYNRSTDGSLAVAAAYLQIRIDV